MPPSALVIVDIEPMSAPATLAFVTGTGQDDAADLVFLIDGPKGGLQISQELSGFSAFSLAVNASDGNGVLESR